MAITTPLWIIAAFLIAVAASKASTVLAPLALAIFIIAIIWPIQKSLETRLPRLVALAFTMLLTVGVCMAFASLAVWGFRRVGQALVADAPRYQSLYENFSAWLDTHGVSIAGLWSEHFNVSWALRATQQVTGRVNTTLTFWLITLIYVVLGLLEVESMKRRIERLENPVASRVIMEGSYATARKFRRYMFVRTQMSAVTGLVVGTFAWAAGLPLAMEWGVIAFVLNYIPFIGPLLATLFPTLIAMTHFDTWPSIAIIFASLNVIQFIVGSYVEPRVAGNSLSVSPPLVLFAIFLWTSLWGLFGTFIGVPMTVAILTFSAQHPSTRWVSQLLGTNPASLPEEGNCSACEG